MSFVAALSINDHPTGPPVLVRFLPHIQRSLTGTCFVKVSNLMWKLDHYVVYLVTACVTLGLGLGFTGLTA